MFKIESSGHGREVCLLPGPSSIQADQLRMEYRVARSREELEKAYSLVYKEYLSRNYTKENSSHLRFSLYNAFPYTTTFVAITGDDTIVATATIVPDSPLGLPMDDIYRAELEQLRKQHVRICEVTMLASDLNFLKQYTRPAHNYKMLSFFKVLYDYVREIMGFEYLCIAINPQHGDTFDSLLFDTFGDLKNYPEVNDAPAVGKYIDLRYVEEELIKQKKNKLYEKFVEQRTDHDCFTGKALLSPEDLRYFFVGRSPIFINASPAHLKYIKSCYAMYDSNDLMYAFADLV